MDMDTLITVVFVAVIIAFQLFGSIAGRLLKQGRSAPGQSEKKEGLLTRVGREIQRAMEEAAAKQREASHDDAPPDRVREEEKTVVDEGPGKKPAPATRRPAPRRTAPTRPAIKKPERRTPAVSAPSVARSVVRKQEKPAAVESVQEDKALMADIRQGLLEAAAPDKPGVSPAMTGQDGPALAGIEPGNGYEADDLRRAVVWSEILAPPVALRE
ncbi:MAG: hypothetical protein AB1724_07520 [Thermodesulfobacteriota bacterium]